MSRCRPMAITRRSTAASPIDLMSIARNGGDSIWDKALIAASSIALPLWGAAIATQARRHKAVGDDEPSGDLCNRPRARLRPRDERDGGFLVGLGNGVDVRDAPRQIGPVQPLVIEAALDGRLHHREIG